MDKKLVEKKFLWRFGWLLIIWIMVMNAIIQTLGVKVGFVHFGWTIFLGNIMFFTMHEENLWKKFAIVEVGGLVGIIFGILLSLGAVALAMKGVPAPWHILLPLLPMIICLIIVAGKVPYVFNNVGFAYLIASTINPEALVGNIPMHLFTFLVWGTIFNLGGILLWKLVMPWAIKAAKKEMESKGLESGGEQ